MKGIPLKTWEVQAILDNRKSVIRRVVKPQEKILDNPEFGYTAFTPKGYISVRGRWIDENNEKRYGENFIKLPYRLGDILYARETFAMPYDGEYRYRADYEEHDIVEADRGDVSVSANLIRWRSPIHMPREAARIFLRVTDVWVERLQEITADEALKEGFNSFGIIEDCPWNPALMNFEKMWGSTIKPEDRALYGWDANPWVFVITFEQISKDEALK